MRIEAPSVDQLTLTTERNRLFMALGAVLMVIGVLIGLTMAKVTTFTCHRTGPDAAICRAQVQTSFWTHTSALLPLRWLEGARVEAAPSPFGWTLHRLVLSVDDGFGPYPFTWHFTRDEAQAHARRVNGFLTNLDDASFKLSTDHRPPVLAAAGAFFGLGLLFLANGAQRLQVIFHRGDRLARVRRRGLIGTRAIDVPFDDIKGFEVAGVSKDCNMFLLRHTGRPVALTLSTDWEAMVGPRAVQQIRRRTAERAEAFLMPEPQA